MQRVKAWIASNKALKNKSTFRLRKAMGMAESTYTLRLAQPEYLKLKEVFAMFEEFGTNAKERTEFFEEAWKEWKES